MILSKKWVPSSSEKCSTRSLSAKRWRVESKAMGLKTLGFFVFLWWFIKRITKKNCMAHVTSVQELRGFSTGIIFNSCSMGGRALLNLGRGNQQQIPIGLDRCWYWWCMDINLLRLITIITLCPDSQISQNAGGTNPRKDMVRSTIANRSSDENLWCILWKAIRSQFKDDSGMKVLWLTINQNYINIIIIIITTTITRPPSTTVNLNIIKPSY